jgi:hypothetical protein
MFVAPILFLVSRPQKLVGNAQNKDTMSAICWVLERPIIKYFIEVMGCKA